MRADVRCFCILKMNKRNFVFAISFLFVGTNFHSINSWNVKHRSEDSRQYNDVVTSANDGNDAQIYFQEKRYQLGNGKKYENSEHKPSISQICPLISVRKGKIIKTNASIKAGAKFLEAPSVGTVKECHEMCCHLHHCNTAIVKVIHDNNVSCYLFDCGIVSVCSFDTHKDYKVIELKSKESPKNDDERLIPSNKDESVSGPGVSKENKKEPIITCLKGYHGVANECREDCNNEFYFECANVDRPTYRQCIATYDRCDGYQQCDDNSDEISCSSKQEHIVSKSTMPTVSTSQILTADHSSSQTAETPSSKMNHKVFTVTPGRSTIYGRTLINYQPTRSTIPGKTTHKADKSRTLLAIPGGYIEVSKLLSKQRVDDIKSGAIVALSLGISLTFLCLIMIACRLQQCRKQGRNRKTKSMNGDSDYLINGLYL